jgi:hypothetical protein
MPGESIVRVQQDWNSWRSAEVRLCDLEDIHWMQPKGSPRPLLHGYVNCRSVLNSGIPHACDDSATAHRLRVCILKRHVPPLSYFELVRLTR